MQEAFVKIFKGMIEKNIFRNDDYNMMALEYTATINALINQRDRFPDREEQIIEKGKKYINYFIQVYKYENK